VTANSGLRVRVRVRVRRDVNKGVTCMDKTRELREYEPRRDTNAFVNLDMSCPRSQANTQ
jgi:hypothetical protein